MNPKIVQLSHAARQAIAQRNGRVLHDSFTKILQLDPKNVEGHFLKGIFFKVQKKRTEAKSAFKFAFETDTRRYDAAVELADLLAAEQECRAAKDLLDRSEAAMENSPYYLNFAGEVYTRLGLHDEAWPLFKVANDIQPNAIPIESNLAASAAKIGEIATSKKYYKKLLSEAPENKRHHFELSRLGKAKGQNHIREMEIILDKSGEAGPKNIFLYFALGKEYEDLENWEKAFDFYNLGNHYAAQEAKRAKYDVRHDIDAIRAVKEFCNKKWLKASEPNILADKSPIFIVGLPRTGTTLVERILSAHSKVESVGESFFLDTAIKAASGQRQSRDVSAEIIKVAAMRPVTKIMTDYMDAIAYRRSGKPYFIEKLPLNFLNIGFILKAMPKAKIVVLDRKPMDACFAMFKQPYFRFSYDFDWLADYYMAFTSLRQHWLDIAGHRIISISYEELVHKPEAQIRALLSNIELEFEQNCLDFHLSKSASATASFAQIRRRAHTGSVNKWSFFERQLEPLSKKLKAAGIDVLPYQKVT